MKLVPWKNKTEKDGGSDFPMSLRRLRQDMNNMLGRFFDLDLSGPFGGLAFGPKVDVAESDNEVTVTMDLPGVNPKEVEIHVRGNVLNIRGERKSDREEKGRDFHFVERHYGSFQRSIPLPTAVDDTNVTANYKNGVLTVTLPKHPAAKPRKIAIKSE